MDYTTIQNAATKIVDNIKVIDGSINALQNKQDIISTSDMSMANSHEGKLKIEEIGGKCEQVSTTGAQLFDKNTIVSGMNVGTDGNLYNDANTFATDYILIGGLSNIVTNMRSDSNGDTWGIFYTENKVKVSAFNSHNTGRYVFDVPSEAYYVRIGCLLTLLDTAIVVSGNVLPAYEPYTGGQPSPNPDYPQEIKKTVVSEIKTHGKNFLNSAMVTLEQTINGLTFTPKYDVNGSLEYVEVNGTSTASTEYGVGNLDCFTGIDSEVDYILSGCPSGGSGSTYRMIYLEWNSNWNEIRRFTDVGSGVNITHDDNTWIMNIRIAIAGGQTVTNLRFYPMIRKADVADDAYEPYTESTITLSEPIELYGIGDVKDTIDVEKGKVRRKFASAVFDGSSDENWYTASTPDMYMLRLLDAKIAISSDIYGYYCSHYIWEAKNAADMKNSTFKLTSSSTDGVEYIAIKNTDVATLDNFKALLSNDPITVVYELAEEVTEPLPLIDQAALSSLSTYDGITYLEFDSEIEPIFKGEYGVTEIGGRVLEDLMTGLNSEILAQSDAERITALESTIVNNI